jgi:methionyl-tRNA formyltransferase
VKLLIAGYYTPPIHALEILFAQGYMSSDVALLTYDDARNQTLLHFASAHGIEVQTFSCKSNDCYQWLRERQFDTLLSLYYRHIIPQRVLDLFNGKAANLHAGLLPEYTGCWSSAWAIINGAACSGYTWHYMTAGIDEGRILIRDDVRITSTDTAYSLYHRVLRRGISDLTDILGAIQRGIPGIPQEGERRYYNRALPHGGYINPEWDKLQIDRFIRAMIFPPFRGAMLKLSDGTEREILSMVDYEALCPTS